MSSVPVAEPTTADALALVRAGGRRYNEHLDLVLVRRVSGLAAALVAVGVLVLACLAAPRPWGVPVVFATAALGSAVAVVLARGRLNLNWLHLSSLGLDRRAVARSPRAHRRRIRPVPPADACCS